MPAGVRILGAGNVMPIIEVTASGDMTHDDYTVLADATAGNITLTLPPSSSSPGKIFIVKRTNAAGGTVTLTALAGELIDTALTRVIAVNAAVTVQADGNTTWYIIADKT